MHKHDARERNYLDVDTINNWRAENRQQSFDAPVAASI